MEPRRGEQKKPVWPYVAAALGFLAGLGFDLLPFRLGALGLPVGTGAARWALHALSAALTAAAAYVLARCLSRERALGRVGRGQMLVLFLALNALAVLYICTSRTVYVWDNAGYWAVARSLCAQHLGRAQLRDVLESTVTQDYNYLLAFPISLVMRLCGESRAVFLLCITNLYTLPLGWGLCALRRERRWGGLALAGCLPMAAYIGLVGFVDVAACACAVWAAVFWRRGGKTLSSAVLAGAMLTLTFVLRRYFFFYACAFGLAAGLTWLVVERKQGRRLLALYGSVACFTLYAAPNFLADKVVGGGFRDLYSAYALGLRYDVLLTCRYFGLAALAALLVLAVIAAVRKKEARGELLFGAALGAACYLAFVTVQTHGQQHLLMYVPALALLVCAVTAGEKARWAPGAAAAVLTAWCLVPKAQPASIQEIPYPSALPSFTFYGPVREDADALVALGRYVDGLSAQSQKTAAVLSSSMVFNSETLTNLWVSLNIPAPEPSTLILHQGPVDRVDAMNWGIFDADYLIVADPVQAHLGEENQRMIACPAHDVLSGTGLGTAYRALPETFALRAGVTVRVYERVRAVTDAEKHALSAVLTAAYPDYAEQYTYRPKQGE